jgi:hypothetical protein
MTNHRFKYLPAICLIILCSYHGTAQITVLASDFPGKGDTVRYSVTNNIFNNYTATGANYSWNFGNLTPQSQLLMNHLSVDEADFLTQSLFGSFVIPKYRATYYLPARELPLATVSGFLNLPVDEIYRFFRKTDQQMTVVGLSISAMGFALGERADSIEVAYIYPMTFGQNYSSEGSVNIDLSGIAPFALKQYRTRTSEVDGWGTITTPYGTFECLRIHHVINEFDSIFLDAGTGPTWVPINIPTIHEYEWWSKEQKGPILKAKANEIFGFPIVNEVMYRDIFRLNLNVSIDDFSNDQIKIYPNPTSDYLNIQGMPDNCIIEIYTMTGKLVKQGQNINSLDVRNLENGAYFVRITSNKQSAKILKFIKQ